VRETATSMSVSSGSSPPGQGLLSAAATGSFFPVAQRQRSRAIPPSTRAASPSTAIITSWNGG
jgi:hypothetical protein